MNSKFKTLKEKKTETLIESFYDLKIGAVIPAYKVEEHIRGVIINIPEYIKYIVVVDDNCPNKSGEIALEIKDKRVHVIFHKENKGVGGAVITGYKYLLQLGMDVIVKIDGDGQMDTMLLPKMIEPILEGRADYAKGNRFSYLNELKEMPLTRLFGNSILSFTNKIASGYWDIMDPTNGFTAITSSTLESLDLEKIAERYFFESDMLINLGINRKVVIDVPMPAIYANEISSLSIKKILIDFPPKILKGLLKRMFYRYYIYDFNMLSIYLPLGMLLTFFGGIKGITTWLESFNSGLPATSGSIVLSALTTILGVQFLLQAVSIDIQSVPRKGN